MGKLEIQCPKEYLLSFRAWGKFILRVLCYQEKVDNEEVVLRCDLKVNCSLSTLSPSCVPRHDEKESYDEDTASATEVLIFIVQQEWKFGNFTSSA